MAALQALVYISLIVLHLVAFLNRALRYMSERWRTFVPLSAFHAGPASDYELAMLTEGCDLVVLVALLNLESLGALKLTRASSRSPWPVAKAEPTPSILASIGSLEAPADPVETAVYRAVLAGYETEKEIGAESGVVSALNELRHSLVGNGLLLNLWPVPPELGEHSWFQGLNPRTLLGDELVRRLRKAHPGEVVGTLIALFGANMLTRVDPDLAHSLAQGEPRRRRNGFFLWTDSGGDCGNFDTGGTC